MDISEVIDSLPSLKTTVDAYGLLAKKALGQNFLLDKNITDKIVNQSLQKQKLSSLSGAHVFEVGSGPGGLTRSCLKASPDLMTIIELDDRCIKIAQDMQSKIGDRLEIVNQDALDYQFDFKENSSKHIFSNLPYNISVPLLTKWLYNINSYQSLTLMFQKEVADRIESEIRSKDYGRLSVLAQLQCHITRLFNLPPEAFTPAPKVWSSVLLFTPRNDALDINNLNRLEKITALAFSKRRKMLRQIFKSTADFDKICEKCNILPTMRPEEITPQQFYQLSKLL
ncbi:MAG: ribosomal RNA small subunit methyltransferase A [Alphaproteobacteria bacterium]|nr:ribosomal RNA small subunit methyltransferase A [Alphaproteobacteria bacterium]